MEAIAAIQRHWPVSREVFDGDDVLRFFYLKQLEIVREAVFKISSDRRSSYPSVPWHKIERTRHILVHDYFDVDWDILWDVLQRHIEPLRVEVERIVHEQNSA